MGWAFPHKLLIKKKFHSLTHKALWWKHFLNFVLSSKWLQLCPDDKKLVEHIHTNPSFLGQKQPGKKKDKDWFWMNTWSYMVKGCLWQITGKYGYSGNGTKISFSCLNYVLRPGLELGGSCFLLGLTMQWLSQGIMKGRSLVHHQGARYSSLISQSISEQGLD